MSEPTRVQLEAFTAALRDDDAAAAAALLHKLGIPDAGWQAVTHLRDRLGEEPATEEVAGDGS